MSDTLLPSPDATMLGGGGSDQVTQQVGGDKIAENTGNIKIKGDNTGTSNTGVIDNSTNTATANAQEFADNYKASLPTEKFVSPVMPSNESSSPTDIEQEVGGDKIARDTGNINIGGNNYGTSNTGVIDYSVNIGSAGGGSGGGTRS